MEEQLFAPPIVGLPNEQQSGEELFIGREWLFKELCQQLLTERAQMVLLLGASGTGKSAIARQLFLHSPFCDHKLNGQQTEQQQHNTVDSGIAVSAGSGGGNSSGSQLVGQRILPFVGEYSPVLVTAECLRPCATRANPLLARPTTFNSQSLCLTNALNWMPQL